MSAPWDSTIFASATVGFQERTIIFMPAALAMGMRLSSTPTELAPGLKVLMRQAGTFSSAATSRTRIVYSEVASTPLAAPMTVTAKGLSVSSRTLRISRRIRSPVSWTS